jgi:hypothetical protein
MSASPTVNRRRTRGRRRHHLPNQTLTSILVDIQDLPPTHPLLTEPSVTVIRSYPDQILEKTRALRAAVNHKMRLYLCREDIVICHVSFRPVSIDDTRIASIEVANCHVNQDRVHDASYILFNRLAQILLRVRVTHVYYTPPSHIPFYRSIGFRPAGDVYTVSTVDLLMNTARLYR